VLANDIVAPIDLPGFTNTAMDGIALSAAATSGASTEEPVQVRIVGAVDAGTAWTGTLTPLEAVRIGTGAAVPDGCDTVIPAEEIEIAGDYARITAAVPPGRHLRHRGEDLRRGATALRRATQIRPQEIGLLAALGIETIDVIPRPTIATLSIGPELFGSAAPVAVQDVNGPMLAAMARAAGADVVQIAKTAGSLDDLQRSIEDLSAVADLVVTSGGISNSPADTMSELLANDAAGECWQLRLRPGKHFGVARRDRSTLIALPGNPVAAFVGFELLVRPAIDRLSGKIPDQQVMSATLIEPVTGGLGRTDAIRGHAWIDDTGRVAVVPAGNRGSGVVSSLAEANCLIILPEEIAAVGAADTVQIRWVWYR